MGPVTHCIWLLGYQNIHRLLPILSASWHGKLLCYLYHQKEKKKKKKSKCVRWSSSGWRVWWSRQQPLCSLYHLLHIAASLILQAFPLLPISVQVTKKNNLAKPSPSLFTAGVAKFNFAYAPRKASHYILQCYSCCGFTYCIIMSALAGNISCLDFGVE